LANFAAVVFIKNVMMSDEKKIKDRFGATYLLLIT
jgi:hypothetical protein